MKKICLNIVYNHRYDKNIPKVERLYEKKFSRRFHLMPFYEGLGGMDQNVIPVFESSHNFEGFFQQAFPRFYQEDTEYYCFIADDLILNPRIYEENLDEWFPVDEETAFIKELVPLSSKGKLFYIPYTGFYFINGKLVKWDKVEKNNHGIYIRDAKNHLKDSRFLHVSEYLGSSENFVRKFAEMGIDLEEKDRRCGNGYPLLLSFSDLVIVPKKYIRRFCYLCGVFAAADLHAELAIPTALAMACRRVSTEEQHPCKGRQLHHSPSHIKNREDIMNEFGETVSWIHPIKLSQISV